MRGLEAHPAAPRAALFRLNGLVGPLNFTVRITSGGTVPVEKQSAVRGGGLKQEIGCAGRADVRLMPAGTVGQGRDRIVIAQQRLRIGSQHLRRVFDGVVPVLNEEVIARGEAAGRLVVEMILGDRIGGVVEQGNALFDVQADFLVNLTERSALVLGIEVGFGVVHIRDAHVITRRCGIVGHAEHVRQHEMRVGAAQERFAFAGLEFRRGGAAQFLDGRQRLIGVGDVFIVGAPNVARRIVVAGNLLGPFVNVLIELVVVFFDAVVADVVRREFGDQLVTARSAHIGRNEDVGDFLLGIQRGAQVGILIQKIAARHQRRNDDRCAQ